MDAISGGKQFATASCTCCDGVCRALTSLPMMGATFESSLSKCLAKVPIEMMTLCLTASWHASFGASSRNFSNRGSRLAMLDLPWSLTHSMDAASILFLTTTFRSFIPSTMCCLYSSISDWTTLGTKEPCFSLTKCARAVAAP
ncbi:hypothetical protein BpHYR1_008587 [Brachionus plicatilis]|uniref:Uncharacterized protein n=1 Tax=Brachionus plicatilis TaxID=10195 RepID=A0A3M7PM09_BRAPC|nr:hypothetical protein BpHYR1_008587 [Brachionus plicatilis]